MELGSRILEALGQLKKAHQYRSLAPESGISFSHNDYLGLSQHPRLKEAGAEAVRIWGAGSRGSRLLGGNSPLVERVEAKLAEFFDAPSALFFSSGYLANWALVQSLSPFVEKIYSDSLNHASLIDAIRLTKKPKVVVPHGEWGGVSVPDESTLALSESLFSMDGDVWDEEGFEMWRASPRVFCHFDEAHAAGLFKQEGQGLVDKLDVNWERTAFTVTFGKAFGVGGGAILGAQWLKDWLVNRARSFIYTTAPSPSNLAMVEAALEVLKEESWRREELWERAKFFRERLATLPGRPVPVARTPWEAVCPIVPFHVPGDARVVHFCARMREAGFELKAIRSPTVAPGKERVRISLNLGVSRDNTEALAEALESKWKAFLSQEPIQA